MDNPLPLLGPQYHLLFPISQHSFMKHMQNKVSYKSNKEHNLTDQKDK